MALFSSWLAALKRDERGQGLAVDSSGKVYVTGLTTSGDFPVTAGAY